MLGSRPLGVWITLGTGVEGMRRRWLLSAGVVVGVVALAYGAGVGGAGTVPSGFTDSVVYSGLTQPTAIAFAPDGHVFVAEKSGIIKVFASVSSTTPTVFADLRTEVHNWDDRGLVGLAVDPNFPANPYVYVLYTYDAPIGGRRRPGAWPGKRRTAVRRRRAGMRRRMVVWRVGGCRG